MSFPLQNFPLSVEESLIATCSLPVGQRGFSSCCNKCHVIQLALLWSYNVCHIINSGTEHTCTQTYTQTHTCVYIHKHLQIQLHQPSCGRDPIIFLPSSCILGKPSAAMITLQYSLKVSIVALFCKCSNKISFASSSSSSSMSLATSAEITPLRFSLRRPCLGLMMSKNSFSYVLRNVLAENGKAAWRQAVKMSR